MGTKEGTRNDRKALLSHSSLQSSHAPPASQASLEPSSFPPPRAPEGLPGLSTVSHNQSMIRLSVYLPGPKASVFLSAFDGCLKGLHAKHAESGAGRAASTVKFHFQPALLQVPEFAPHCFIARALLLFNISLSLSSRYLFSSRQPILTAG